MVARSAFELADQIRECGYDLIALQTEPGDFVATFEVKQFNDCMILGITGNRPMRFVGTRNMQTTCFSTMLAGGGAWQSLDACYPAVAGYHFNEKLTSWGAYPTPDSPIWRFGCVLFPREKVRQAAEQYPRAKEVLEASNLCLPDELTHSLFAEAVANRFAGIEPECGDVPLMTIGLQMLNSVQHVQAVEESPPVLVQLAAVLAEMARRIRFGEDINAKHLADAAGCGSTALNKTMKQLTGMTPGKFINLVKTETAIQLLIDPIKRRALGLEATTLAVAGFVHWDEKTLRTNLKKQRNVLPGTLLQRLVSDGTVVNIENGIEANSRKKFPHVA